MTPEPRIRIIDLNDLEDLKNKMKDQDNRDLIELLIARFSSPDKTRELLSEVFIAGFDRCHTQNFLKPSEGREEYLSNLIKD